MPFLWFLLRIFNVNQAIKLTLMSISFIIFRVGYQLCYTQLMAALAGDPTAVVFEGTPLPPLGLTIITFSITCIGSSYLAYRVDQIGQNLGNQCRLQLIWSVQAATLRSTQSSISGFDSSEVVSLAGIDGMAIRWCTASVFYMFAVPIELGVLIWLSTTQVGVLAALVSLLPLVLLFGFKLVLVKLSSPRQRAGRDLLSKRFGILSECIASNSVIKLMGMSSIVLRTLGSLRKQEQNKYMVSALSNALSLATQVISAPLMAWISMIIRSKESGQFTSGAIMTVLGYYRTISTFDLYKIVTAIQGLSLAMVAADKYMAFFAMEATQIQQKGNEDGEIRNHKLQGTDKRTVASSADFAPLAELEQATFTWQVGAKSTLSDLSFRLDRGKLIAVCGPIGSGKSSLLLSLLGELQCTAGSATLSSDWAQPVAYSSQRAWLQTGTVRENICFAEPISVVGSDWLQTVIECCGLQRDIEGFPEGIDHDIGEAGASLSGGQKARLSLARAFRRPPVCS
jgi:ABC-type multidrug transport system fused ATPase/permease subunit